VVLLRSHGIEDVVDDGSVKVALDIPHLGGHRLADQREKELLKEVLYLGLVRGSKTDDGVYEIAIFVESLGGGLNRVTTEPFISSNPCHDRLLPTATPPVPTKHSFIIAQRYVNAILLPS
jgi:hypothetical protein